MVFVYKIKKKGIIWVLSSFFIAFSFGNSLLGIRYMRSDAKRCQELQVKEVSRERSFGYATMGNRTQYMHHISPSASWSARSNYDQWAALHTLYKQPLPDQFFDFIKMLIQKRRVGYGHKKVAILDIGTGSGLVALDIAKRFGTEVEVTGIDGAEKMIAEAIASSKRAGLSVYFKKGTAEYTGFFANTFDIVITAGAWQWFVQPKAMIEVKRILKPNGFFLISHYRLFEGPVMHLTRPLIQKYNRNWQRLFDKINSMGLDGYIRQLAVNKFTDINGITVLDRKQLTQAYWAHYINKTSVLTANPKVNKAMVEDFNKAHQGLLAEKFGKNQLLEVDFQYYVVSGQWKDSIGVCRAGACLRAAMRPCKL